MALVFRRGLFAGKTAIVSGGGSGIGKDVARQLLGLGANVLLASRAVSSFGRIDCLVNNGGGQFPCAAEALSDNGWSAVLDTNLTGTFRMAREAVTTPGGLRDTGGSIVNVICLHEQGFPSMAHTGAARAGVKNLTKSLAVEWANYGIRVNAVAPGIIFSASAEANYSSSSSSSDADAKEDGGGVFAQMLSSKAPVIPFRRLGSVREVSNAICFLLGPGGSYMSGTCLEVDGALNCAGVTGSDVFLRRPAHGKSPREAFPVEGDDLLPDFCVADDDRVQVVVDGGATSGGDDDVAVQIRELEAKLAMLRRDEK